MATVGCTTKDVNKQLRMETLENKVAYLQTSLQSLYNQLTEVHNKIAGVCPTPSTNILGSDEGPGIIANISNMVTAMGGTIDECQDMLNNF